MTPATIHLDKPPALGAVKKLKFRRSPELRATVIRVGRQVQQELEKESRLRNQSMNKVLRTIVKAGQTVDLPDWED